MAQPRDPSDFNECVSKEELTAFLNQQRHANEEHTRMLNGLRQSIQDLITRVNDLELQRPQRNDDDGLEHVTDDDLGDDDLSSFGEQDVRGDGR